MTEEVFEEDHNTRLSRYLSKEGKIGVLSDIISLYFTATTILFVLNLSVAGIPSLALWISGFALFIGVRLLSRIRTPNISLTKNGTRFEVIREERSDVTVDKPDCDEHGCESQTDQHVRSYEAFYFLGYEVSRQLVEDRHYCAEHYAEHYPLDGLSTGEEVEIEEPDEELQKVTENQTKTPRV